MVLLCGDGTRLCHGWVTVNPTLAHAEGFHVKPWEDPAKIPIHPLHMHIPFWLTVDDTDYPEVDMHDPWEN